MRLQRARYWQEEPCFSERNIHLQVYKKVFMFATAMTQTWNIKVLQPQHLFRGTSPNRRYQPLSTLKLDSWGHVPSV